MLKIVTFNVNGIRSRLHQIEALCTAHDPDVIALQECKVSDEQFPITAINKLGYIVNCHGQKGHYGVAFLSKINFLWIAQGLPQEIKNIQDFQAVQSRLIMGRYPDPDGGAILIINAYFPQGEARNNPTKFQAKQQFYADLLKFLNQSQQPQQKIILLGDFNVAPLAQDIGIGSENAQRWLKMGKCCFLPEEREWLQSLIHWGFYDAYRELYSKKDNSFSWFDYRSRGFEQIPKKGLRIDHILLTAPLRAQLRNVGIDEKIRGMERPSDHCPVWVII